MSEKTEQYWNEIQQMAKEVQRLSVEVQGPLIDEHIDLFDQHDMGIDEISSYIEQFYDEDTHLAWDALEVRGTRIVEEFGIDPTEVSKDVWTFVAELPSTDQLH